MRLIVTGGAGFIGSAVVRMAVDKGHDVLNIDALTYAACLENLGPVQKHPRYAFLKADIRDHAAMASAFADFNPNAVLHLAAETHVDRSIDGPDLFVDTNVAGTCTLLGVARDWWESVGRPSFRFHHISTDEVFGSLGPEGLFSEETPYTPRSPYAASKASSDHLVRAWYETYDLPVVLSNCSNNYGPYQFPEKLIPLVIIKAISGEPIPVYGNGGNVRDWLNLEDHVDALFTVLEHGKTGRSYNIGGEAEMRNLDLVNHICSILDEKRPIERPYREQITFVADRPGHDKRYAMDITRIRTELGWRPRVSLAQGLEKTIAWYLDNEAWWRPLLEREGASQRLGMKAESFAADVEQRA
ncbi:dTDP-glucose 4,6-dehydratase [Shimia abyssi]|uniref:dTDP-glucose 4,6-dehydratase n=1 Tax=Shimia abyssi TaxID=1662395 RepID=A0A2P8F7E6_9RHOB|nr:dTDP-glucose 4,6-dehydratase [Shimia abyssi]PSL17628.1 dTDP-glucose 4,6-dehydratase [Shimia abyssi]